MARELRRAARELGVQIAAHDGLIRMIYAWERGDHELSERYELLYRKLGLGETDTAPHVTEVGGREHDSGAHEARMVAAWITSSNTSDELLEELARTADYLAEAHTRMPPRKVLSEVLGVHHQVRTLLQNGRQRLRQSRELLRIDSRLMAHACLLLGDLGQNQSAREYGTAALLLAREAEIDEGIAWSAQAKTARWQERFTEAAELARHGFKVSSSTPTKVELAYREANAIALFGDATGARIALRRAQRASDSLSQDDQIPSVWSFPSGRQAIFSLSIALHTQAPADALSAAEIADANWAVGEPRVLATWAQVRAGAAIAHVMMDSLDGASAEITPLMGVSPELRIGTVTGYLQTLDRILRQRRFLRTGLAVVMREQIRDFNAAPAAL